MIATVNAGELAGALKTISPAVASKTHLPILTHVLLDARDGLLTLSATDLEITLATSIPATVTTAGRITASAKSLEAWVSVQLGRDEIELKADPKNLHLTCGRNRSRLSVADPDDVPPAAVLDGEAITLDATLLGRALEQILPAVGREMSRPVLAGACLTFADGRLELVGCDGLRLGFAAIETPTYADPLTLIIPAPSLSALAKLLRDGGDVAIRANHGRVRFEIGATSLTSQLIEGTYPDWRRLVATEFATVATVRADALRLQLQAATIAGRETPVRLRADGIGQGLTVWAREMDVEHEGEIEAKVGGASIEVALNVTYARQALEMLDAETVEIAMNAPNQPVVLSAPGGVATGLQLLMPMHVKADNTPIREAREAVPA